MSDGLRADPPQGTDEARRAVELLGRAREAMRYLFSAWLPTEECLGPRDCVSTERGCSHCAPDARLEAAREVFADLDSFTVESANSGPCAVPEGDTPPKDLELGDDETSSVAEVSERGIG